jgi:hypothetical protein
LRCLAGAGGANDLSDADLLERFRARPEEAAFTLLVQDEVRYLSHNLTRQPLGWPTVEC